jgi:drug/metabolite transporter (DMT)-like permease
LSPDHRRSILLLVAAALCWSVGGVLIKTVAADWPALAVAGARGLIAALFLAAAHRGVRLRLSPAQWIGATAYAATTLTFCAATTLTSAANAILLQYTAPVWVALLGAWLLGERATRADWITIAVALGGMALFFKDGLALGHAAGDALSIFSGLCFAAMTIALRREKTGSAVDTIIAGNVLAFLVGLPWIVSAPPLSAPGWTALLALGIVQLGFSYLLYARAIRHVTALEAVLIPVIEPILNPVWVMLFLGERPTAWALAGGAVVLGAVTLRAIAAVRARAPATGT